MRERGAKATMSEEEVQNPKMILMDLARELDGETLEHTCMVHNHKWTMRLLNEEESNWRNGFVNMGTRLSAITSWRLPTLAIGIRAIDGVPIFEFFKEQWSTTEELRKALETMEGRGKFSQKYFAAEHLMEFLSSRFPEVLEPLWEEWQKLEERREGAQASIKKSFGENSGEGTKPSGTESSPSGDE